MSPALCSDTSPSPTEVIDAGLIGGLGAEDVAFHHQAWAARRLNPPCARNDAADLLRSLLTKEQVVKRSGSLLLASTRYSPRSELKR